MSELFEARAERDYSLHKVQRLEARLEQLFSAELREGAAAPPQSAGASRTVTSRENELMATIAAFQRALEQKNKAIGVMVPASKFMQVGRLRAASCSMPLDAVPACLTFLGT